MADILNDRNLLLYNAAIKVVGSVIKIDAGVVNAIVLPKAGNIAVPNSATLSANTVGYVTPTYAWSYRFGTTATFTNLTATTSTISASFDTAWITAATTDTVIQYKVSVTETAGNMGANAGSAILSIPIIREGKDGNVGINSITLTLYKRTTDTNAPTFTTIDLAANSVYTFTSGALTGQPSGWGLLIPSNSSGKYLWTTQVLLASTQSSYSFANTNWSTPSLYSQDGITPITYLINLSSPVIVKNAPDAATTGTHTQTAIQGKKIDDTGTANFGFVTVTASGDTEATTATDTSATPFLFTPADTANRNLYTVKLYDTTTKTKLLNTQTLPIVFKGASGSSGSSPVFVSLSNETVSLSAKTDGTIISYVGAGASLSAYEGGTLLTYDGTGATNGTWSISVITSNISVGALTTSPTQNPTQVTYGDPSAFSSTNDTAFIKYIVSGKTANGTSFSVTKIQNFSKSKTGIAGTNTVIAYAYQRSASELKSNPGAATFDFSTNTFSAALANSWTSTIPAGTDPLYITGAVATSSTTTASIAATAWSNPVILVQNGTPGTPGTPGTNGTDGTNGTNSATLYLYARNNNTSTAPTLDTASSITYNFSSGAITGTVPPNWSTVITSATNGSVIWVTQVAAISTSTTININNTAWKTPVVLSQVGTNGTRGTRQLYDSSTSYTSTYTLAPNTAGLASYQAKATALIATATTATTSTPTTPIAGDTVTFYNSGTTPYVFTLTYNSANTWVVPTQVIDGSLLVTGSVTAAAINTNDLTIKDSEGITVFSATTKLKGAYIDKVDVNQITATDGWVGQKLKSNDGLFVIDFANKYIKIDS